MVSQFSSSTQPKDATPMPLTQASNTNSRSMGAQRFTQVTRPLPEATLTNVIPFRPDETTNLYTAPKTHQADLIKAKEQVKHLQRQVQLLTTKLEQSNHQTQIALEMAKQPASMHQRKPEPTLMPTTYVVPKRFRSETIDRLTTTVPFSILTLLFGMGLTAAVALTAPSIALWIGLSPLFIALLRGLFIAIAFSSVISFFLELWQARLA